MKSFCIFFIHSTIKFTFNIRNLDIESSGWSSCCWRVKNTGKSRGIIQHFYTTLYNIIFLNLRYSSGGRLQQNLFFKQTGSQIHMIYYNNTLKNSIIFGCWLKFQSYLMEKKAATTLSNNIFSLFLRKIIETHSVHFIKILLHKVVESNPIHRIKIFLYKIIESNSVHRIKIFLNKIIESDPVHGIKIFLDKIIEPTSVHFIKVLLLNSKSHATENQNLK